METTAEALRRFRTARGWSQTKLAEVSGIDQRQISRYEVGQEPGLSTAAKLAFALGVSLDELAGGSVSETDWHAVCVSVDDSGAEEMRITPVSVVRDSNTVAFTRRDGGWTVVGKDRATVIEVASKLGHPV
ncbi:helix-turn-helix transcriptional regulator [Nocardia rhamnosiphila]|uniref:helix-turn-helix domain-containing protein n=1 Tax=Nocardia rhamnosiphila TaxID=426716 RepID=UPI0033F6A290